MKLSYLLTDAKSYVSPLTVKIPPRLNLEEEVIGITDDSREVKEGYIFICVKGANFDGHNAADEAAAKGAYVIIAERDVGLRDKQIIVPDSRKFYGYLCAAWFFHPERKMKLIGITGTNGKTTMASMICDMISSLGKRVGFIGTTGVFSCGEEIERDDSTPTTPRVWEFMSILSQMENDKCEYVVMEVTSFALAQNRIGPARFRIGIFTNLTQDHLDYHNTMENYYLAKRRLFTEHSDIAIINTDDNYGKRLYNEITCEKYSYGKGAKHSIYASDIVHTPHGMNFVFCTTSNKPLNFRISLGMIGSFNVLNATAAIACCLRLGMTMHDAAEAMHHFKGVRGRCEIIPTGRDFTVICDYAHSPDALANVLPSIKEHTKHRLICLFGCGGDRDSTKRPLMAKAVEKYADRIIVTSDNPRNEDPDAIIDDIVKGFSEKACYERITDRKEAIFHGISIAERGDILVLAGKGHEDYQILADGVHIHFDEREIVAECLKKLSLSLQKNSIEKKERITLDEVCTAVSGKPHGAKYYGNVGIYADEISSDTRTIKSGALFVGLKGEHFDGSSFAKLAIEQKGACCALTNRIIPSAPCIVVNDTRKALLSFAEYFRKKFHPIVVGVTGSVGKTTSKDLIALALSSKYNTLKTEGNLNNDVGLPFTILRMTSETQAAVIEMGMSHAGEIKPLSEAAKPSICVITNIGYSHIENFGSQEGIYKEKLNIISGASADAPLIVNGDDQFLRNAGKDLKNHEVITCGVKNQSCDYTARNIVSAENNVEFDVYSENYLLCHISLPVTGKHYVMDALIAAAVARRAGCKLSDAAGTLECYAPSGLRQHIMEVRGQKIIVDCYNAAPDSMKAAIDVLSEISCDGKRVCVFGDMLELGSFAQSLHAEIGKYAAEKKIDVLICYGTLSEEAAKAAEKLGVKTYLTKDYTKLMDYLGTILSEGDAVLFKGSRKMALEKAVKELYGDV